MATKKFKVAKKTQAPKIEKVNLNKSIKPLLDKMKSLRNSATKILDQASYNQIKVLQAALKSQTRTLSKMEESFLRNIGRYEAKFVLDKDLEEFYKIFENKKKEESILK